MLSDAYVRLFFQSVRCDYISDLSKEREDYTDYLGKDVIGRLLKSEETAAEQASAAEAVTVFTDTHERSLISSLSWKSWFEHYTVDKAERTLAFFGVTSAGYAGMHCAFNTYRKIRGKLHFLAF